MTLKGTMSYFAMLSISLRSSIKEYSFVMLKSSKKKNNVPYLSTMNQL